MQEEVIYLVYADHDYGTHSEDSDGTISCSQGHTTNLRGVATSPAAASGLILKDYVQTLLDQDIDSEKFPLVYDGTGDDDAFVVDITWQDGLDSGHSLVRWYVKEVPLNDLIEEE